MSPNEEKERKFESQEARKNEEEFILPIPGFLVSKLKFQPQQI
jgi:hypothetical protein